jgi:hypothetical protein
LFLGALVVYYMVLQAHSILCMTNANPDVKSYIGSHYFAFFYSCYMVLKTTQFTELLNTKEGRIRQLMLPASSLEKFISRALGVTVVPTILFIVAILLADVVHFAFYPFFPILPEEFKVWVFPELWKELLSSFSESTGMSANIISGEVLYVTLTALLGHSIFILFGNVFERHGFIAVVGLSGIVSIFNRKFIGGTIDLADWGLTFIHENGGGIATCLINAACLCSILFIWGLSYKVFSRKQVIQPKFRL